MLPNQNNKMSSRSIVREMPEVEIALLSTDDTSKMNCDHDNKMNCDHDIMKHGTHEQSTHA